MSEFFVNDTVRRIDWAAKMHVSRMAGQVAEQDLVEWSDEDRQACRQQYLQDLKHLFWTDKIQNMPTVVVLYDRSRDDISELMIKRGHLPASICSFTDLGDSPNPYNNDLEEVAAKADYVYVVGDYIDSPDCLRLQQATHPDVKVRFISDTIDPRDTFNNRQVQNFQPNQELL